MKHCSEIDNKIIFACVLCIIICFTQNARAVEIQQVISSRGVKAWLLEDRMLPITSISFSVLSGASADPVNKAGLSKMVSLLLDEGAGELNSKEFKRVLENRSIKMSFSVSKDYFSGSLKTLNRSRIKAFEMLKLAITEPRFDNVDVERIRSQLLAEIASKRKDPDHIAKEAMWSINFPDHPYASKTLGTDRSIGAITKYDLHDYVEKRFALSNMRIGVAGDITPSELAALLDSTFSQLPKLQVKPIIESIQPSVRGDVYVYRLRQSQSNILFSHRGLPRDHPDYYGAYILNHILGGGSFTSRLYEEVREKRGLAYSVYSYLLPMKYSALWVGGASTDNLTASQTIQIIQNEWGRIHKEQITQQELSSAQDNITGSLALRFDSTSSISDILVALQRRKLGVNYIDERNKKFKSVTLEDLRRIAKKWIDPDFLDFIVVGQPEGLKDVKTLNPK
ncbi:MAG: peptidase M16 [Alphaproteobacteria bacterium]|jgi:zinc protease|nr:peptidase M16 [Alphaproteobacteria bacterium]PPR14436.1 MAG: putative zinc protease [Alphaproteobacteria bacterium MarineAlpha12_Bin1]|tara:strand:- start:15221 stop:16576 length:1356 start_codon:yes stop_codon:yes gene_type:complete